MLSIVSCKNLNETYNNLLLVLSLNKHVINEICFSTNIEIIDQNSCKIILEPINDTVDTLNKLYKDLNEIFTNYESNNPSYIIKHLSR